MIRIGLGIDAHRLVKGRKLILGGVEIFYDKGLLGHSDADVLCHAIADALLGAAALRDIGEHFPDTDPRYKDISSVVLLGQVREMLNARDWAIENIDTTLVLQQPRIAPFIDEMQQNIAHALRMNIGSVSIKATTFEGMGFEGSGEGIAAHAVALISKKTGD